MIKRLLIYIILAATCYYSYGQVVVIDPGHNDDDIVNCDANPITGNRTSTEVNTNWDVAKRLETMIHDYCFGWIVEKTKNSFDDDKSIGEREDRANEINDATNQDVYFLSIHCNAAGIYTAEQVSCHGNYSTASGTETFYCNNVFNSNNYELQNYAQNVQNNMVLHGCWTNRRCVEDATYYCSTCQCSGHLCVLDGLEMFNCLNEIGFQDNQSDILKLNDPSWRHIFANAYFLAFKTTFNQEIDMGISDLLLPKADGEFGTSEEIKLQLKNYSTCGVDFGDDSLKIRVNVEGPNASYQVFEHSINSGYIEWNGTYDVTITNSCNLDVVGSYCINAEIIEGNGATSTHDEMTEHCLNSENTVVLNASFTTTPSSGTAPLTVQFNSDQSTGNIISWQWDFNNEPATVESFEENPAYTFTTPGAYTVKLTVSDGTSSQSATHTVTVSPQGTAPVADFKVTQLSFVSPYRVQLEDLSTESPTSWEWELYPGVPQSSTVKNPLVTYSINGTKTITLRVSNAYGSGEITKQIYVTYDPPEILTADFTITDLSPEDGVIYAGSMVELKDASTGGTVDCWYWIITEPGNYFPPDTIGGCNIIYQNETVVLNDIGTFTIKLCVSNDDSESSITKTVEVVQFQTYDVYAQMTYIDGCACGRINQQMGFKDQSYADGPIKGIRVDWQDGQTDYFTEAMSAYPPPYYPYLYHTYKNAGHYNIHYWVFGNGTILDDTWAGFNAVNCNSTAYSSGFGGSVHDTWGGADTYYAGTFKVAGSYGAYVVQSNKDITLNACNSVQLLPGFKTQPGCHFVATASDPCLAWKPKNAEKIRKTPVDQPQKQEVAGEWSMLVYPNPNTGIFSIAFGGDIRTIKFVEVVDVLGKVVYKKYNVSENIMEMDFPSSTKGMYLIRAVVNGELVVEKMVIE